jgi:hypothetical protein
MHFGRLTMAVFAACFAANTAFWITPVRAETTSKTVTAGQDTTLLETRQKLDLKAMPKKGIARVDKSPDGQLSRLIYTANDTTAKASDELTYTLDDGAPQPLQIDIEPAPGGIYQAGAKVLFLLFVLAAILESALAVVFNWRPFAERLNARAVRPLISFIVAYIFVDLFSLDVVTDFVNAATFHNAAPMTAGKVLTALVLAGGSAGVNTLLVNLGYRERKTPETLAPKPPPTVAWIAVRVRREKAVGPIQVFIGVKPDGSPLPPLVGVIAGSSKPGVRYFLSDPGRFPGYGGHAVPANTATSVALRGTGESSSEKIDWGPYTVGGGAYIDLEFKM